MKPRPGPDPGPPCPHAPQIHTRRSGPVPTPSSQSSPHPLSSPRRRGSSSSTPPWIPACAGMTRRRPHLRRVRSSAPNPTYHPAQHEGRALPRAGASHAGSKHFIPQPLPPQFCRPPPQERPPGGREGAARRASPLIPGQPQTVADPLERQVVLRGQRIHHRRARPGFQGRLNFAMLPFAE